MVVKHLLKRGLVVKMYKLSFFNMNSIFVIDLLGLEKGKAYGFQEYIFNLLNYFYQHREVSMNKGEYFEPTNVEGLADKMLTMSFEKQGYGDEILEMFSEENTSAKYVELINRMYAITHRG